MASPVQILNGVVGRVDRPDGRWYVDPLNPDSPLESVSMILSDTDSKPWMANWSAKLAAEFVVDNFDYVTESLANRDVGREGTLALIKNAASRKRDLKADIGTHQHDILENLIVDAPIPSVPEHLAGIEIDGERIDQDAIADGLLNFIADYDPVFEMAEATVANPDSGYAGTLDVVAWFPTLKRRLLIDLKTGTILDEKANAQLAAYRNATEVWVDDMGNKADMPQVDGCAILHLRREYSRGYKLMEQPADNQAFQWFLDCRKVLHGRKALPSVKGRPIYPPRPDGTQPLPLLEDLDVKGLGTCLKPLARNGIKSVADLTMVSVGELQEIKGIGPVSVKVLIGIMSSYHADFAGAVI